MPRKRKHYLKLICSYCSKHKATTSFKWLKTPAEFLFEIVVACDGCTAIVGMSPDSWEQLPKLIPPRKFYA